MGGAKLDRRLEVGAHAHAQIGEAELRGELGKKREMQPRCLFEGWNAHQASDLERELFATEAQQTRCLFREHAGFLWFLAGIDLDEKLKAATLLQHGLGDGLGDLGSIDGVDSVEQQ